MNKVFDGLEKFGFDFHSDIDLYSAKEKISKKSHLATTPKQHTFLKEITCPVCDNKFKTPTVKVNSPRSISKDSDFFIRYSIINPYFYEIWICDKCGYSALKSDFNKVRSYQIKSIKENITPKWKGRSYPDIFDEKIAIERYKLALLTSAISNSKNSTKAILCLKIAWMFRLLDNSVEESLFLSKALEGLVLAYYNESFPLYGLDKYSTCYLIGELNRRLGNFSEALSWLSIVIVTPAVSSRIKELARDSKDLIKK